MEALLDHPKDRYLDSQRFSKRRVSKPCFLMVLPWVLFSELSDATQVEVWGCLLVKISVFETKFGLPTKVLLL